MDGVAAMTGDVVRKILDIKPPYSSIDRFDEPLKLSAVMVLNNKPFHSAKEIE